MEKKDLKYLLSKDFQRKSEKAKREMIVILGPGDARLLKQYQETRKTGISKALSKKIVGSKLKVKINLDVHRLNLSPPARFDLVSNFSKYSDQVAWFNDKPKIKKKRKKAA